ncbi:MAG: Histidine kinase, partial [Rhizorhabdus sp.]|nr:Histidine kinase [Rhizorhabdus sp.]
IAFAAAVDPARRAAYDVQYRTIGVDDRIVRWVAAKGKGLFDEQGRCIRAVGTTIDISARRSAEARNAFMLELTDVLRGADSDRALVEACRLMGGHFAASRVGYGHLDAHGALCNYRVCWSDGSLPLLTGQMVAPAYATRIVDMLKAGQTVAITNLLSDPISMGGERPATPADISSRAALIVPFMRSGELSAMLYLNDVNPRTWTADEIAFMEQIAERTRQIIARVEAETQLRALNATLEARVEERTEALRTAEAALRQAQKMEAVGQLTGGIAHDFNNLLTVIMGNMDMAARWLPAGTDARPRRAIDNALKGAHRATQLVQRLLAFSRRQPLAPRPTDVGVLIAGMADLLARSLGETVLLKVSADADLWKAEVDPAQLENSLLNLAVNARDAMPGGGELWIASSNVFVPAQGIADHGGIAPGSYVVITVSDSGVGMAEDIVARVFEPFFTTKEVDKGTGLGLSMVYGFVKQSGGDVRIMSEPGNGTDVSLYLPRTLEAAAPEPPPLAEPPVEPDSEPHRAEERILVVEDDAGVRRLSVASLREMGYTVFVAPDGPSALDMLRQQRIDLIFTDVVMPVMSGRELAEAAIMVQPDVRILFTSGYTRDEVWEGSPADPRFGLLTKPFTFPVLARKVREVLDER